MMIVVLKGFRCLTNARKDTPHGNKNKTWKEISDYNSKKTILQILYKKGKIKEKLYDRDYTLATFSGNDNAFMMFKLSANNMIFHKFITEGDLTKLNELSEDFISVNRNIGISNGNLTEKFHSILEEINPIFKCRE